MSNSQTIDKKYTGYIDYYLDYALRNRRRYSYLTNTRKSEHPELYIITSRHIVCDGWKELLVRD
jgi:hypothetical protein